MDMLSVFRNATLGLPLWLPDFGRNRFVAALSVSGPVAPVHTGQDVGVHRRCSRIGSACDQTALTLSQSVRLPSRQTYGQLSTRNFHSSEVCVVSQLTIVVMEGDQTGQELLNEALRVLSSDVTGMPIEFLHFDLSLENRRKTENRVVYEAAQAMKEHRYGLKAATITPEKSGDVGGPNAILRKEINGTVIVRTGRRIPGIAPPVGVFSPISVVRMAVDDAYGAKEWREKTEDDEIAFRTEKISRKVCRRCRRIRVPTRTTDQRKGLWRTEIHGQPSI